jgi:hypothetical protein
MRSREALACLLVAAALLCAGCGGSSGIDTSSIRAIQPPQPPRGAVVDARQWGSRDVGVARVGDTVTVHVVSPQGNGVDGLRVRVDGRPATACGRGCYRTQAGLGPARVSVGPRTFRFTISPNAPSGARVVANAMRAYARLRTSTLNEHLTSGPTGGIDTTFEFAAPDRLRYAIRGGPQAVVIGPRRWDRPSSVEPWVTSPQDRVRVMHLPWEQSYDAHVVAPNTVTFFDPHVRAWFRLVVDPRTSLPRTVHMTGISHFMTDRYSRFDAPSTIAPPTGVKPG